MSIQGYGVSSNHVWMWESDNKESWAPKNWYFWTIELKKTHESPLDYKEIKPVNPEGNQSWIFIERIYEAAEAPIFGHLMWKTDSLQRPWCWERLKVGAEGDGRRWAGCMASPIWWTWVWVGSRSWWWIGKHAAVRRVAELDMTQWLNWIDPVLLVALPLSIPVNNNFREVHYSSDSQGSPFRLLSGILPWS